MEQTYIMIKPDGVQRGLVGAIIARFETKGFYLRGVKMMSVTKQHAEKHYADLSSKPFFGDLVDYMCSGPVVCMVWEGKEVVKTGRKIIGATNPLCVPLPSPPSIADAAAAAGAFLLFLAGGSAAAAAAFLLFFAIVPRAGGTC